MKAISMLNRMGQFVVLAIGFLACVGWNQATGLQNDNISSIAQKRVKDMVKIRYILPHSNLHTMPTLCASQGQSPNPGFDHQDSHFDYFINQTTWSGTQSFLTKQADKSCKNVTNYVFNEDFASKNVRAQKPLDLILAAFSGPSTQITTGVLPSKDKAAVHFTAPASYRDSVSVEDDFGESTSQLSSDGCQSRSK